MQIVPDDSASQWLDEFVPDPYNFDWDEGNAEKNLKHGVSCGEIEEIFDQETPKKYFFAGRIVRQAGAEWRGLILGQTNERRLLALIYTPRGSRLRPISCRPMRSSERRTYEARIKEYS